jgi:hypothetical protein
MKTHYLIADAYPRVDSTEFSEFAGAIVGCWIRQDSTATEKGCESIVQRKLAAAGWQLARVLSLEIVSRETYAGKIEGREFFEQAQEDGFVANFHVMRRLVVGDESTWTGDIREAFVDFVRQVEETGAVSMYSQTDSQWANGAASDGNEFVPLWVDENVASAWMKHWPGYRLHRVRARQLQSELLEQISDANMWVALGLAPSTLTTFHPLGLRALLGPGDP